MALECDNCGEQFDERWELEDAPVPGQDRKICPECEDPQGMFSDV
jgi:hypothetical protein